MRKLLGEILLDKGSVTREALARALHTQTAEGHTRRLGEILRTTGLTDEALAAGLAMQFDLPLMSAIQVPEALPLDRVSFDFLIANKILPLTYDGNLIEIALADPTNTSAIDSLRASFDADFKLYVAPEAALLGHIETLQASKDALMQRLLEGVSDDTSHAMETGEVDHLRDLAQEKGIIQLANLIIENAIKEHASDIHVEPEEAAVRVRYRIDGILYERENLPVKTQAALASRLKLLANMNIAERRLPQDGRIRGRFAGKEIDIRVSTIPTIYGESIVMRLLDKETAFLSLEQLGFDHSLLDTYEALIRRPYGMILMTGPTGSGKSTSLYASLDRINSPDKKIITIEEPVEYLVRGISQIQVKPKIGLTFASGLRHIVRQDPDIIMVGEIRDIETASIGIHASLTGHLLFSTLHTNDAPSAITRLVEMGVENYLVASTLIGVVAQRLVRRVCSSCAAPLEVTPEMRREFGLSDNITSTVRGKGCESCMNTGYRGRMAIFEFLVVDDPIRELITARAPVREIKERAVASGMRTLRQDGLIKVQRGITTLDEVFRVTQAGL